MKTAVVVLATLASLSITGLAQAAPSPAAPAISNANSNAAFWTPENMKNAKAFDMVVDKTTGIGNRVEAARGAIQNSTRKASAAAAGSYEAYATGKVFFSVGSTNYVCSGSLVKEADSLRAIVLTAGHCVWDNATSKYVTNFVFVPNYAFNRSNVDCTKLVNCWGASALFASSGFTSQTKFTTTATLNDWGFAVLKGTSLPDANGYSYNLDTTTSNVGSTTYAFGYPQASPYDGTMLYYTVGKVGTDPNNGNKTYKLVSDLTGGASGGPWIFGYGSGSLQRAGSLNSYRYNGGDSMYGPMFNANTRGAFESAMAY